MGTVGRESGQVRLAVCRGTTRQELEALVLQHTQPLACCNTDEWPSYRGLPDCQRVHRTVNHGQKQWAKDQDGDGLNEVHTNTIEGLWTGLRNLLRTFRGVCKWYLYQYCAVHEWRCNTKAITPEFCQALCFNYNEIPI